jgi:hypothetical protein
VLAVRTALLLVQQTLFTPFLEIHAEAFDAR